MTAFQAIASTLMLILSVIELVLMTRRRTRVRISMFRLIVWLNALLLILWPELTTVAAGWLSIGRGADVILYLLAISFLLAGFYFLHVVEQHRIQITTIVRELAKQNPYFDPKCLENKGRRSWQLPGQSSENWDRPSPPRG